MWIFINNYGIVITIFGNGQVKVVGELKTKYWLKFKYNRKVGYISSYQIKYKFLKRKFFMLKILINMIKIPLSF